MGEKTEHKARLQSLVDNAQTLLKTKGEYFTEGAKLALTTMVKDAVLALHGEYHIPFIRNREFYKPREEEAVLFATKRYTMAPTYNMDGNVYHEYGLEPALTWFNEQDMLNKDLATLQNLANLAISKAEELLAASKTGTAIGQFDTVSVAQLQGAIQVLNAVKEENSSSVEHLAKAVVHVINMNRDVRFSRVLRTDVDMASTLYLTPEGLQKVKELAQSDALIQKEYEQIVNIANTYSLDYIEKALNLFMKEETDYEEINKHFYVWSSTDKIVNFRAPEGAVKAALSFILPAQENEQEGLGHVWIDNVNILSAQGGSLTIENGGFDEGDDMPFHWQNDIHRGTPILKWEGQYPFCGGGAKGEVITANPSSQTQFSYKADTAKHSIYICNPTPQDEGGWSYDKDIPITGGLAYTLTFAAKIDGKLKQGLKTVITFKDEMDHVIDVFDYDFNRKSSLPNSCFLLTMQCDAIQYAFTQDVTYAFKAKNEILYTLNDFCQGAEHWLACNSRPDGSDSYGAVQGGRVLCSVAVTYSFIKEADVFTREEKERFYSMIEYLLPYMLDLRDRTELSPLDAQHGSGNWQTDMCAGTAYMMIVLDDFPNRKAWFYNAYMVLKAQLELNVNPDSSWPESIRYHHAALERFAGFARVLDHAIGENWFETTLLARMFDFSIDVQTPGYSFFDGRIGTPPFGDHALSGGAEFGSYGTYLGDVEKVDKALADRMYHTWHMAGKPFKKFWGEGIALDNILGKGDSYKATGSISLDSTLHYKNAGIYVFRKNFGSTNQSYFAIMSSPEPIAHGHLDQGSFILYKNSIPLVMDSGIEGYFDSSTSWHISSYSHACMQFATQKTIQEKSGNGTINLSAGTYSLERGWVDVPRTSKVVSSSLGSHLDTITIQISNPEGKGIHTRKVLYVKEYDLYIIRDTVQDFEGELLFNLPVAAKHSYLEDNRVYSEGIYDVDLETFFVSNVKRIELEKGRSTTFFETEQEQVCLMDYVRATSDAREGFLTILHPKVKGQKSLHVMKVDEDKLLISIGDIKLEIDVQRELVSF
ncbi:heparinase [Paenibacillus pectinilyticus]|uniref:Heparinase n=1 Tax=Paenibacillus pectinilyticus TaxID=512399 RepID=A0A1C0ZVN6_9BACL|nr:heparinase II/III family protein [Paenibacillus pectinilyticus]OCT12174.1 heparinase [Paenibacillus pectinilyticus]